MRGLGGTVYAIASKAIGRKPMWVRIPQALRKGGTMEFTKRILEHLEEMREHKKHLSLAHPGYDSHEKAHEDLLAKKERIKRA